MAGDVRDTAWVKLKQGADGRRRCGYEGAAAFVFLCLMLGGCKSHAPIESRTPSVDSIVPATKERLVKSNHPGNPLMPAALVQALQDALTAKGPGYKARTRHIKDGAPLFTNRLILQDSPYLLQHAHNPVNWFPWGDEAFALAKAQDKPVFLSVGYSTCHWCHVMEEESFEDEEIAAYLNKHFVCIKIDREERPDVDAVYMAAVQAQRGSGGWPMSVFVNHHREPFFSGTYFPPRDGVRGARQGFLSLLKSLRKAWDDDRQRVDKAAGSLAAAVKQSLEGARAGQPKDAASLPGIEVLQAAVQAYKQAYDPIAGGTKRVPKFPSSFPLRLLLRRAHREGDKALLQMVTHTLTQMASGGMYDQLGGGFHRYSTDGKWLVPHFEKMLYDNALLAVAYAEAFQMTGEPMFKRVCREILDYVAREMTAPSGGFYAATDADSLGADGKRDEGLFFVWSSEEIASALGPRAKAFSEHYGVTPQGNFEGHNILFVANPSEQAWRDLQPERQALMRIRQRRHAPLRDDKILTAWNGLMISAFAVAGRILDEPQYISAAARAADHLLKTHRKEGRLMRKGQAQDAAPLAFLEDYAFFIQGLLDLFQARFEPADLRHALALAETMQSLYGDARDGGWFSTASDGEALLAREKPTYDGAEPSGTSVALLNALRIGAYTSQDRWRVVADRAFAWLAPDLERQPMAMSEALIALDFRLHPVKEVLIVWPDGQRPQADKLFEVLSATFLPGAVLAGAPASQVASLTSVVSYAGEKVCKDGAPTAYVCEMGHCEQPTGDPGVLLKQLAL